MELKKVLVTGASSGIGAALVRALTEGGRDVLAVARRHDVLADLSAETGCQTLGADVRQTDVLQAAIDRFEPDVLVNNAGVGHGITGISDVKPEEIREALEINMIAPAQITALTLEGMKRRGRGHIVNIGSVAGLHTIASAVYSSGKAAIHQFSQNLRVELLGTGLRVTEICPGRVSTEFYDAASGDADSRAGMKASGIAELHPGDVANAVMYAIDAPWHVNVTTIELLPTEQAIGGAHYVPTDSVN